MHLALRSLFVLALLLFKEHPGSLWLRGAMRPVYDWVFWGLSAVAAANIPPWGRSLRAQKAWSAVSVGALVVAITLHLAVPRSCERQFRGTELGHLREAVAEAYAARETEELILFEPSVASRLERFRIATPTVTRCNWLDVVVTICEINACLSCDVDAERRVVTIGVRSEPVLCRPRSGNEFYVCPSQSCE